MPAKKKVPVEKVVKKEGIIVEDCDVTLSQEQRDKVLELPTTSARVRYLHSQGYSRKEMAKVLGKLYQHIRNILVTPLTGKSQ